jgi:hypothetical protein
MSYYVGDQVRVLWPLVDGKQQYFNASIIQKECKPPRYVLQLVMPTILLT